VGLSNTEQVGIAKSIRAGQSISVISGGTITIKAKSIEITAAEGVKINGKVVDVN
jgi:phage gp45-like